MKAVHELAPHYQAALRQIMEPGRKRAIVARIKAELLGRLRPHVDTWPISDDAIVTCALGMDLGDHRGPREESKPIPEPLLSYFRAARWCVAIEESPAWNALYERRLLDALRDCAGPELTAPLIPLAEHGRKFKAGRKPGTGGPIRKAIAKALKRDRTLTPRTLWAMLADSPPRGWEFCENHAGKYAAGSKGRNMSYKRFQNVAKEERDKLK